MSDREEESLLDRILRYERADKRGVSEMADRLLRHGREEKKRISELADRLAANEAEEKDRISKLADRLMESKKEDDERISRLADRLSTSARWYDRDRSTETTKSVRFSSDHGSYPVSKLLYPERHHSPDRDSRRHSPRRRQRYYDDEDEDDCYYYYREEPSRRHRSQLLLESPRRLPRLTYGEPSTVYETITIRQPKKSRCTTPSWLRGRSTFY